VFNRHGGCRESATLFTGQKVLCLSGCQAYTLGGDYHGQYYQTSHVLLTCAVYLQAAAGNLLLFETNTVVSIPLLMERSRQYSSETKTVSDSWCTTYQTSTSRLCWNTKHISYLGMLPKFTTCRCRLGLILFSNGKISHSLQLHVVSEDRAAGAKLKQNASACIRWSPQQCKKQESMLRKTGTPCSSCDRTPDDQFCTVCTC
jgi:hypothetical protein